MKHLLALLFFSLIVFSCNQKGSSSSSIDTRYDRDTSELLSFYWTREPRNGLYTGNWVSDWVRTIIVDSFGIKQVDGKTVAYPKKDTLYEVIMSLPIPDTSAEGKKGNLNLISKTTGLDSLGLFWIRIPKQDVFFNAGVPRRTVDSLMMITNPKKQTP